MVFSTNDIITEINITTDSGKKWVKLIDFTGVTTTVDGNIVERDTIDSIFTKRTFTGGIKYDFSFEGTLNQGNELHEYLRKITFSENLVDRNDHELRFTFPKADTTNTNPRTETYTGIIKTTALGPAAAEALAVINFDFMSNGKPTIVAES